MFAPIGFFQKFSRVFLWKSIQSLQGLTWLITFIPVFWLSFAFSLMFSYGLNIIKQTFILVLYLSQLSTHLLSRNLMVTSLTSCSNLILTFVNESNFSFLNEFIMSLPIQSHWGPLVGNMIVGWVVFAWRRLSIIVLLSQGLEQSIISWLTTDHLGHDEVSVFSVQSFREIQIHFAGIFCDRIETFTGYWSVQATILFRFLVHPFAFAFIWLRLLL